MVSTVYGGYRYASIIVKKGFKKRFIRRCFKMVGITSYGAYIPYNRLSREEIYKAVGVRFPQYRGKRRWPATMRMR